MASPSAQRGRQSERLTTISLNWPIQVGPGNVLGARPTTALPPALTAALIRCLASIGRTCRFQGSGAGGGKPSRGLSLAFVAPDVPAPTAPVIWLPEYTYPLIEAGVARHGHAAPPDFDVGTLPFAVHVHFAANGAQYVVLKSSKFHVALVVTGRPVTMGAVRLQFVVAGIAGLDIHLQSLGALAHVLRDRRLPGVSDRPGEVDRIELRDALIAIDGERAGATRRQIAAVTFGDDRVAAEWSDRDGSMRHKIKRDLARGRRLINGGYRDLLQRTPARAFGETR